MRFHLPEKVPDFCRMAGRHDSLPTAGTLALTAVVIFSFAANSLLCRFALHRGSIDPASFFILRLVSGALGLAVFMRLTSQTAPLAHAGWGDAALLFTFAGFFSFAYAILPVSTGALILMGTVQLTMFGAGFRAGERLTPAGWLGLALAVAGFVGLVAPTVSAPTPLGAALMAIAGVAWGVYSLHGRRVAGPLESTAGNFARAAALALMASVFLAPQAHADAIGIAMAVASGSVTSGMGFVIWYAVLRRLSTFQAATVQLSVPLVASLGGALFLSEPITPRIMAGSVAILVGIALVMTHRATRPGG